MIRPEYFFEQLTKNGIAFYTGIPDSLLKDFCAYLTDNVSDNNHIIATNEGSAAGLACGYHLSTNKIPLVYMQNSGLGNCVNPILSLADKKVYSIPLLLLIGWRGEPGVHDEPQHITQGEVTLSLLDAMRIPYLILDNEEKNIDPQLKTVFGHFCENNSPFAIVIKKETFGSYKLKKIVEDESSLGREDAIAAVVELIETDAVVISTTGMISRELYELRDKNNQFHNKDFLTVGSMGHASQIALGIALNKPEKKVYCFDGDGAFLMHLGGSATLGSKKLSNYVHIIFNNCAHDSVGGQPTIAGKIDIQLLAKSFGYASAAKAGSKEEITSFFNSIKNVNNGPILLEISVKKGSRKDLGRPKTSPLENKNVFMDYLKK